MTPCPTPGERLFPDGPEHLQRAWDDLIWGHRWYEHALRHGLTLRASRALQRAKGLAAIQRMIDRGTP